MSITVNQPIGDVELERENATQVAVENLNQSHFSQSDVTQIKIPRLVIRDLPFEQSRNRVQVFHDRKWQIFGLLRSDWYHVLLRLPLWVSLPSLLGIWTLMIIMFAGLYVWVDRNEKVEKCTLGVGWSRPIDLAGGFAFSLETCTTVGYTLPNGANMYFEPDCHKHRLIIYLQMSWSMMYNAFLFAFFYSRLAKAEDRGSQVVLSKKAIVSMSEGHVRFQVRVYDVDSMHPVVESHIRMYAVTKSRPVPRQLRLIQPNDELNAMLLLSVPTVVSHHIDLYSILHPPQELPVESGGLTLRQADSINSNREEVICPVCGESYGTFERWQNHVVYQRIAEEMYKQTVQGTHLGLTNTNLHPSSLNNCKPIQDIQKLKEYFRKEVSEVICVVEGIEPLLSGTFSSLHSYQFEDIVFEENARFSPCVEAAKNRKGEPFIRVDLDRFHGIEIHGRPPSKHHHEPQRSQRFHDAFFSG